MCDRNIGCHHLFWRMGCMWQNKYWYRTMESFTLTVPLPSHDIQEAIDPFCIRIRKGKISILILSLTDSYSYIFQISFISPCPWHCIECLWFLRDWIWLPPFQSQSSHCWEKCRWSPPVERGAPFIVNDRKLMLRM